MWLIVLEWRSKMTTEENGADNPSKAESFPLRANEDDYETNNTKIYKEKSLKSDRRLSFNQSVSQLSSSGSKTRINLQRPLSAGHPGQFLELPVPEGPSLHLDLADRFLTQRSSFDLPALRQIVWIVSFIGFAITIVGFILQIVGKSVNVLDHTA